MRRILTQNLTPGMKLANSICTGEGKVLLGKGVVLRPSYIDRLKEQAIMSVYIDDDISAGIEIEDVIGENTRIEAIAAIKDISDNIKVGKTVDSRQAKQHVNKIVDDLSGIKDAIIHLNDVRSKSDYTFCHMVNVAVLSLLTGIALEYDELKLRDLGVGALLHDLGMQRVDEKILNKPDQLSFDEYEQVKQHPLYGFAVVRDMPNMSVISAHVAFQHHERFDGNGYPRQLVGKDIHEYARIVAIADVYDALTSDRPYRRAMLPGQAVEYLIAMAGKQFDPQLVAAFIEHIAIFPIGSVVELNTKEKAIVLFVDRQNKTRPTVRIFADAEYRQLPQPIEMDLMTNPSVFINRIIEE